MSMIKPTFLITILFAIFVTLGRVAHGAADHTPEEYLKPHNAARAEVGVGPMVWNTTLAAYAEAYAKNLSANCDNFVHSNSEVYGENLAQTPFEPTPEQAVSFWVDEKRFYNYDQNKCIGAECHYYLQVVWRDSLQVGCAKAKCSNGWWVVGCNYYPPGNYEEERPF